MVVSRPRAPEPDTLSARHGGGGETHHIFGRQGCTLLVPSPSSSSYVDMRVKDVCLAVDRATLWPGAAPTTGSRVAVVRLCIALRDAKVACLELVDDFAAFCTVYKPHELEILEQAQNTCKLNA